MGHEKLIGVDPIKCSNSLCCVIGTKQYKSYHVEQNAEAVCELLDML